MAFKIRFLTHFALFLLLVTFIGCASMPADSMIHQSINNNDAESAKKAILSTKNIDVYDKYGRTALHLAVLRNNKAIVESLINNKAAVNRKTIYGHTALSLSMRHDDLQIANLLLDAGAKINTENAVSSALIESIKFYRMDMSKKLLKAGADIHFIDKRNATAVYYAAFLGQSDLLQEFISRGAHLNIRAVDGMSPIHAAAFQENKEVVEMLLLNGAKVYPIMDKNKEKGSYSTAMLYYYVAEKYESNGQLREALSVYKDALKHNDASASLYRGCVRTMNWTAIGKGLAMIGAFAGGASFGHIVMPIPVATKGTTPVALNFFSEDTQYTVSGYSSLKKTHAEYFEIKIKKESQSSTDVDQPAFKSDTKNPNQHFSTILQNIYSGLSKKCTLQSKNCSDKIERISNSFHKASPNGDNNEKLLSLKALTSIKDDDSEMVNLYIYRRFRIVGNAAIMSFFIDDGYYCKLKCNRYAVKKVKAGKHDIKVGYDIRFHIDPDNFIHKTIDIEKGSKDRYVRLIIGTDSPVSIVSKEVAEKEMREEGYLTHLDETMKDKIYQ